MIEPIMTTEYKVKTLRDILLFSDTGSLTGNLQVYYNMMGKDGWELKKVYSLESGSIDIPFSMRQIHVFERCTFTDEPKETVDK